MSKINKILLFGNPEGVEIALRVVPTRFICAVVGAENRKSQHELILSIANEKKLKFLIQPLPYSENYPVFISEVKNLRPDIILVNQYSQKLYTDLLEIPPKGAINIHMALLPKYRGPNPIQWALLNNEKVMGSTMHFMDENFDTGDIIAQESFEVAFDETWVDIHKKNLMVIENILNAQLEGLLQDNLPRQPQNNELASTYPRRKPADGLIEWDMPTLKIYNLIRALVAPNPGAYYYVQNQKHIIDHFIPISEVMRLKSLYSGSSDILP
jgi:methionyl-tRNA formyltransferase